MSVKINQDKVYLADLLGPLHLTYAGFDGAFFVEGTDKKATLLAYGKEMKCQINFGALVMAANGNLNSLSIEVARDAVESAMASVKVGAGVFTFMSVEDAVAIICKEAMENKLNKVHAIKKMRALTGLGLKEAKDLVDDIWDNHILSAIEQVSIDPAVLEPKVGAFNGGNGFMVSSKPKCQLTNATELYQQVNGTDKNSTYYVIALATKWPGVNVAVRVRHDYHVSIRAEGVKSVSLPNELTDSLKEAGWSLSAHHASLHLDCKNGLLMRKSIGAMLATIGTAFEQVATQFDDLVGA